MAFMVVMLGVSSFAASKEVVKVSDGEINVDGKNINFVSNSGKSSEIQADADIVSVKVKDKYFNKSGNKSLILFEQTTQNKNCQVNYFIASVNDKEVKRTSAFSSCSELPKEWGDYYLSLLKQID